MRKYVIWIVLAIILAGAFAAVAMAGSYTLTTTGAEDTAIARLRSFANTSNLFGAPYATDLLFVSAMCRLGIRDVRDAARAANPTFESALASATPAQKDSLCSTLSLPSGCIP